MMGRLSICDLPLPRDRYRPDLAEPCERSGHRFETRPEAEAEDLVERATSIRETCAGDGDLPFDRGEALDLARRLEESGRGIAVHHTMASKVYMGMMRVRICGALWELADRTNANTFTILLPDGLMDDHQLLTFDPEAEMQRLRSRLNRLDAKEADGYLFGAIHGEFNPLTNLFEVHIHGLARDGMLEVVDRLRTLPGYRSRKGPEERQKVKVGRKPLDNLPYPITYILQSSWPTRCRGEVNGKIYAGEGRGRIPEPYHTALLLWLDRWSLPQITLMMGMRVGREGLILNDNR